MTYTPPFDFAQCETHDETFPLGETCRFHGREHEPHVVYAEEADQQRVRALKAEGEADRLRSTVATLGQFHSECDPATCSHRRALTNNQPDTPERDS